MRILLVSDYGTPTGGVEIMTRHLRDALRLRGNTVRWFASSANTGGGPSEADAHCFGTTGRFRTLLQSANPLAARALGREIDAFQPDVIHVQMFLTQLSPLILPQLARVPSILYVNWYRTICPKGTKMLPDGSPCRTPAGMVCWRAGCLPLHDVVPLTIQMKLWRRRRDALTMLVANSETTRRQLASEGIECGAMIPSGVLDRPPRPPLSDPPTIAFAGRLVPEKGADVLIRAFAIARKHVPGARLIIAGDGPQRGEIERLIDELHIRDAVEMKGYIPRDQLDEIFAASWVQAAPSRWAEPYGLVAPEAMMRGTAVIATTGGGLAETVQSGVSGLLVPPGDADALAEAIAMILANRDLAEQMGAAGREIALQRYSVTVFTNHFESIYHRVIETRSTVGAGTSVPASVTGTR